MNFPKEDTGDFPYWDTGDVLNDVPLSVATVFLARKLRSHDQYIVGKLGNSMFWRCTEFFQFSHDVLIM